MRKSTIATLLVLILSLTSCELVKTQSLKPLEYDDVRTKTGFYAWSTGSFYEMPFFGASFETGKTPKDLSEYAFRYIWFESSYAEQIPLIFDNDKSGVIYINVTDLPSDAIEGITLEYFEDQGYTVGVRMVSQNGYYTLETQGLAVGSSAYTALKSTVSVPKAFVISDLNGVTLDAIEPLWDQNGVIKTLEENAKYMFTGYQGTAYKEIVMSADTRYFVSQGVVSLDPKNVEPTKQGYFIVHMPEDAIPGLYAINSKYLFFYDYDKDIEATTEETVKGEN